MDVGPWRGVKDAILRVCTRRDTRGDAEALRKDIDRDAQSSLSVEAMTVGLDAATGGRVLTLATIDQPHIPVPAPPTLSGGGVAGGQQGFPSSSSSSSRIAVSPRLKPRNELGPIGEDEPPGAPGAQEGETPTCKAQEQLDTLIRNRGYHIKEHIPRRVLEEQVMENIRKRERIARILRHETAGSSPTHQKPLEEAKEEAPRSEKPERSTEMMNLLTKVWSGKGVGVQGRCMGEVDWTRSQFVQDCVAEHNRLRSLHGAPALTLSNQLCVDAQTWANRLAHYSILEYSTENGKGENILTSVSKNELSGSAVAKAWYETGRTFKYNVNESADLAHAGPFSQVVWESTEAVGIGFARGTDGRTVVVARYCPPGNIGGQFSANVKPSLEETVNMNANLGPVMSRTRQEAHFYVSIALEPPGKTKKGEKEKLTSGLKFPRKKLTSESVSSETLLMQSATVDSITPTTPIRNGAARTSKLFPICCVNPTRTEDRWALPSSRSFRHPLQHQHAIQEDSDDSERGLSHKSKRGNIPTLSEDFVEIISYSPHASEDNLFPKQKSILKNSPRGSPRLAPSPRYGEHSRVIQNPQMRLSPRHGASPPQFIAPATMGAASKNNAVENLQEHAVVIATL